MKQLTYYLNMFIFTLSSFTIDTYSKIYKTKSNLLSIPHLLGGDGDPIPAKKTPIEFVAVGKIINDKTKSKELLYIHFKAEFSVIGGTYDFKTNSEKEVVVSNATMSSVAFIITPEIKKNDTWKPSHKEMKQKGYKKLLNFYKESGAEFKALRVSEKTINSVAPVPAQNQIGTNFKNGEYSFYFKKPILPSKYAYTFLEIVASLNKPDYGDLIWAGCYYNLTNDYKKTLDSYRMNFDLSKDEKDEIIEFINKNLGSNVWVVFLIVGGAVIVVVGVILGVLWSRNKGKKNKKMNKRKEKNINK